MPVTDNMNASFVPGVYGKWDFAKCAVTEVEDGQANGHKAVGMKKPSQITSSQPLNIIPYMVDFTIFNPTNTAAKFRFYHSADSGATWIPHVDGTIDVGPKSQASASLTLPTDKPIMLRWAMTSGNSKSNCYLDDIKLYYKYTWGPEHLNGDVNLDGEITISDVNYVIDIILGGDDINGLTDVNGDGEINVADIDYIINMILYH